MTASTSLGHAPAKASAGISRVGQLLLARLLIPGAKKGPTASAVRRQLDAILPVPTTAETFASLHQQLAEAGLVESKFLRLTDAGRTKALSILGISELPAKAKWKLLVDSHLFPLAAGIADGTDPRETKNLAVFLVKRHFNLKTSPTATPAKVLEALAFKELGFPQVDTWPKLKDAVLSRLIGSVDTLKAAEIAQQLPRVVLGVTSTKADDLRRHLIKTWAAENAAPSVETREETSADTVPIEPPSSFDLPEFANTVERLARASATGWFGDNKFFISQAWKLFKADPNVPALDLPSFKQKLVEANREGLLHLSRADLVSAMDPDDVRESETHYLNAEFHFILLEGAR